MNPLPTPLWTGGIIDWDMTVNTVVIPWSARILAALVIALATVLVAGKVKASVKKSLSPTRADPSTILLTSRIAHFAVLVVGVVIVLGVLGLDWTALLALISIISLALSFSIQDVLKSFVAGLYLLIERPFRIGETIKFKDFTGVVEHVGIRTTVLRTEEGFQVLVPNSTVFVEVIVNRGASNETGSVAAADREEPALNPRL